MNTTQTESRALPDAAQITEADVLDFLRAESAKAQAAFPELREVTVQTTKSFGFYVSGYYLDSFKSECGLSKTIDEACAKLRKDVKSAAIIAAEKRAEAAELLAEADRLDPQPQPEATPAAAMVSA